MNMSLNYISVIYLLGVRGRVLLFSVKLQPKPGYFKTWSYIPWLALQCSCDSWKQVRKRLFQYTFAWQCSRRLGCSGLSEYPAKKCLTYWMWSQEDGGEWADCASSGSAEYFFHKGRCEQSSELYFPFFKYDIMPYFYITEFHQSKNGQWYYVFV